MNISFELSYYWAFSLVRVSYRVCLTFIFIMNKETSLVDSNLIAYGDDAAFM